MGTDSVLNQVFAAPLYVLAAVDSSIDLLGILSIVVMIL